MPRVTYFHDVTVEAHEGQTLLEVSIRNSHTTTSVAPGGAAQLVASRSWMESLTSCPRTRSSNSLHPNGDGTSSLALRAKQGFTAT